MIPGNSAPSVPEGRGNILFHVVMDDFNRVFCLEGPKSNGIRLHYEMQKRVRAGETKFRDFDLRATSKDKAVEKIKSYYPGYDFLGECLTVWAKAN
jgi:hypothetical protein